MKISPLARWTKSVVWQRILAEKVPYNPLPDQAYPSIGCWPCTRAVTPGEDERAGRPIGTRVPARHRYFGSGGTGPGFGSGTFFGS